MNIILCGSFFNLHTLIRERFTSILFAIKILKKENTVIIIGEPAKFKIFAILKWNLNWRLIIWENRHLFAISQYIAFSRFQQNPP